MTLKVQLGKLVAFIQDVSTGKAQTNELQTKLENYEVIYNDGLSYVI